MLHRRDLRQVHWVLVATLALALVPARVRAQDPAPPPGGEPGRQAQGLGFELFDELNRRGVVKVRESGTNDPRLKDGGQQMDQLGLLDSQKVWDSRHKKKTIKRPQRFFTPSLAGTTGLLDMPSAYSLPFKQWAMNLRSEHLQADATYWPLTYKSIRNDSRYLTIGVGATDSLELDVSLESWDRTITYNNPILNTTGPSFTDSGKFSYGYGVKWSVPWPNENLFFAAGGRFQFFDNADRSVMELHEYDRLQNVYAVVSGQATPEIWGHLMYKYISYDLRGGLSASGVTSSFPGFSPINAWGQLGLGFEYFLFPNFEIIGELTKDTDIIFVGGINQIRVNSAGRYIGRNVTFEFWARDLNWKGITDNGVSLGWRF